MMTGPDTLTSRQRELLALWFPDADLIADLSWGLIGTTVLHLRTEHGDVIVKAGDRRDVHIAREIRAHRSWTAPWLRDRRVGRLLHADDDARMLATSYLPGALVQETPAETDPEVHRQAGALLALFHGQTACADPSWWSHQREHVLEALARPHRISDGMARTARADVSAWPDEPAVLVPTHGDYHGRNWLVDGDSVRVIDLGRADLRPALEDFTRLSGRLFPAHPACEKAFIAGYGSDPRAEDRSAWRRMLLREAISTAVWAFGVGDEEFERHGLRLLDDLLS